MESFAYLLEILAMESSHSNVYSERERERDLFRVGMFVSFSIFFCFYFSQQKRREKKKEFEKLLYFFPIHVPLIVMRVSFETYQYTFGRV